MTALVRTEAGGSEYLADIGESRGGSKYLGNNIPRVDSEKFSTLYRTFHGAMRKGLIASSISLERGGLGVALAKSALGGELGCDIELDSVPVRDVTRPDTLLYSESQGRFLVSVNPALKDDFEKEFASLPFNKVGKVTEKKKVVVNHKGASIVDIDLGSLMSAYKGVFEGF